MGSEFLVRVGNFGGFAAVRLLSQRESWNSGMLGLEIGLRSDSNNLDQHSVIPLRSVSSPSGISAN